MKQQISYKDFALSLCRESLGAYCHFIEPEFSRPHHIQTIIKHLVKVEVGDIKRLIITMPPRHGKTLLTSRLFVSWFLGRNPTKNVIFATYGQDFADDNGRAVRNILKDASYQTVFPNSTLAEDSAAIKKFSLKQGGNYYAVGAGAAITGRGGDLAIIDDPLRNRADANSPTIRKNILEWYKSTLFTRLSPEGRLIIIQTRWHEDDLVGNILSHEKEKWTVLDMPAIDDDNKALWPERWPAERLDEIKRSIGSYEWAALYQQRPAPYDGGMFKRSWFEKVGAVPAKVKRVRYWDRAATVEKSGNDPDYTVGVRMAKDADGIMYVEDVVRIRASSLEVQNTIKNVASQDGKSCKVILEQDPGQAGKSEVEYLIRMLSGYNVRANRVSKDKVTRASPSSAQAEAGNIKLVEGSWNEEFLRELEVFPYGKHDDQVDAFGQAFLFLCDTGFNYEALVKM